MHDGRILWRQYRVVRLHVSCIANIMLQVSQRSLRGSNPTKPPQPGTPTLPYRQELLKTLGKVKPDNTASLVAERTQTRPGTAPQLTNTDESFDNFIRLFEKKSNSIGQKIVLRFSEQFRTAGNVGTEHWPQQPHVRDKTVGIPGCVCASLLRAICYHGERHKVIQTLTGGKLPRLAPSC